MIEYIGKFIGPNKIKDIEKSPKRTFQDKSVLWVQYADDTVQEFPADILTNLITKKRSDLSELRDLRVLPVVEKILKTIAEADLKVEYIEYCFGKVKESLDNSLVKANNKLWGKEAYFEKRFLGSTMDIHRVLKQKQKDE